MKLRAAPSFGNLFWNSKNVIVDTPYMINLLIDTLKVQSCYNTKRDNSEIFYRILFYKRHLLFVGKFALECLDAPAARVALGAGLALDQRKLEDEVHGLLALQEEFEVVADA